MKINIRIPIISRDQVKVAILVIFFTFSEEFQHFYKKDEFPQKIILQKQKKQKIMQKYTFATPGSARRGAISQFPQIMLRFTKFHQLLVNSY